MAFPSAGTPVATTFATSVTSMPVSMPATVNSGDRLLAYSSIRNVATWSTIPTGFSQLKLQAGGGAVGDLTVFEKIADGTEGGTTKTWVASTGTTAAWQVMRVTGAHASTASEVTSTSGDATSANPPSLTPSWGADDTLWIAVAGNAATGETTGFTAAPTNYTGLQSNGASSGGSTVNIASATRQLNSVSEDPGAFTPNSNRFWAAATIAVRPPLPAIVRIASQDKTASGSAHDASATYPGATTAGNLLIAAVACNLAGAATITAGGAWTKLITQGSSAISVNIFYKLADGTETTITAHNAGDVNVGLDIFEYTGNANPIVVDGTATGATASGSVSTLTTPGITTTNATDLIFVAAGCKFAPSSPFWTTSTLIGSNGLNSFAGLFCGQDVVSSAQTGYTDTAHNGSAQSFWDVAIGAFQAAGSGGTSASVTQIAGTVTASGGTQAIATVNNAAIAQTAATVAATGGTQTASGTVIASSAVTQVAATVTATGGTQSIATVNDVAITQSAGTVTATGGTQAISAIVIASSAISQLAASVTATGGTQAVITAQSAAITQVAASVTATGGTQTISTVNNSAITQVAGTVTASGGTQAINTVNDVSITQLAGNVTATGGTQTLAAMIDAAIAQQAANVVASGGTQGVSATSGAASASIAQTAATVTATGGVQIVSINSSPLPPVRDKSLIFLTDGHAAVRVASGVYLPL